MAEALQALMDEDDRIRRQADLAKVIGKDETWVSGMLRILTLPIHLQRKVGSSQLSISYDMMIRIARLDDPHEQEHLIDAALSGATARDVRRHIRQVKDAKGEGKSAPVLKPKRVFHTNYKASVIVQAAGARLTSDQVVMALKSAVQQALEAALDEDA